MALVMPEEGEVFWSKRAVNRISNRSSGSTLVLKLFTNDYTPIKKSAYADFTEANGNGYPGAIGLSGATGFSVTLSGGTTTVSYPQVTYTFTGALGDVYGYFITDQAGTSVVWAERFSDGPYDIQNNGDQIKVTLNLEQE